MSAKFVITRKTVLGLVAAGLLGSTILTSAMLVPTPVLAQTQTQVAMDPTRSFAPLVERVMPSVVSVQVKIEAASNDVGEADQPAF